MDYNRGYEEKAKEYSDLKERLAKWIPVGQTGIYSWKSALVENILRNAEEWRKNSDRGWKYD